MVTSEELIAPSCLYSVRNTSSLCAGTIITYSSDQYATPSQIYQSVINCNGYNYSYLFSPDTMCQSVIAFTCYHNATSCASPKSSCTANCPSCLTTCLMYVQKSCSEHFFIIMRTPCVNYSSAGGCTGSIRPQYECCMQTSNKDVDHYILPSSVGVPVALLLAVVVALMCALVLHRFAYARIITRYVEKL